MTLHAEFSCVQVLDSDKLEKKNILGGGGGLLAAGRLTLMGQEFRSFGTSHAWMSRQKRWTSKRIDKKIVTSFTRAPFTKGREIIHVIFYDALYACIMDSLFFRFAFSQSVMSFDLKLTLQFLGSQHARDVV